MEAGAHAFWTQPVFEIGVLERARGDRRFGCLHPPGADAFEERSPAEFLHYEVPGINIPRSVRDKLAELSARRPSTGSK